MNVVVFCFLVTRKDFDLRAEAPLMTANRQIVISNFILCSCENDLQQECVPPKARVTVTEGMHKLNYYKFNFLPKKKQSYTLQTSYSCSRLELLSLCGRHGIAQGKPLCPRSAAVNSSGHCLHLGAGAKCCPWRALQNL